MRTTVDIPDSLYRRLKSAAALRGCSVKDLVLRGVKAELQVHGGRHRKKPVRLPIIASKRPGSLRLTNCKINEILFLTSTSYSPSSATPNFESRYRNALRDRPSNRAA
jgi:hypothetical protein